MIFSPLYREYAGLLRRTDFRINVDNAPVRRWFRNNLAYLNEKRPGCWAQPGRSCVSPSGQGQAIRF
jgi:hypothetical protein